MNEAFVPFVTRVPAGNTGESFRVKVPANADGAAAPFQPVGATPGESSAPRAHDGHTGQTQMSLVRDGERITGVRVQCACGEVIELQCVY
jgi:hypothetical protein